MDTSVTQLVLRLNYHPGHTRVVNAAFWHARNTTAYWFFSNPSTVYHAVIVINALISALVLPLGYLACRRLGLGRPAAYGVAFVAALVPADSSTASTR